MSWAPFRRPASFSQFCGLGAKFLKGGKRQAGIFSAFAKLPSDASTHLFVEDRVISLNSAGKQVHQQEKKGWLIISSVFQICISNMFPMEETAQGTRPRPLLPDPWTGLIQGSPGFTSPPWVFKVVHIASECITMANIYCGAMSSSDLSIYCLELGVREKWLREPWIILGKNPSPNPFDHRLVPPRLWEIWCRKHGRTIRKVRKKHPGRLTPSASSFSPKDKQG